MYLVSAPCGYIHAPIMKMEFDVSSSMGQIETNITTLTEETCTYIYTCIAITLEIHKKHNYVRINF